MAELIDEVSPLGSAGGSRQVGNARTSRGVINETLDASTGLARADAGGAEEDTIGTAGRVGRMLSDKAKTMLANIDAHGTVDAPLAAAELAADPPSLPPAPVTPPAAAAVVPTSEPVAVSPDPRDAIIERATARNRELLAELDKRPAAGARGEPDARTKALDEIERMYVEDQVGAIRRLQALALGLTDPAHKDVDAEMSGLYKDLTARELGVQLDSGTAAQRESERTRRMLERDKRDRRAEAAPAVADPEAAKTAAVLPIISGKLASGKHAERFPLLMGLSSDFDRVTPEELIWRGIHAGLQTGELDPKTNDEQLIDVVAQKIETHYQALADKILKARPSTATPTPPATDPSKDSKAGATGQGPRTITNASASVAPATPPAEKPATPAAAPAAPKYRNEAERRRALAEKWADS